MRNIHVYPSTLLHETRILKISKSLLEARMFSSIDIVGKWEEGLAREEEIGLGLRLVRLPTRFNWMPGSLGRALRILTWYWTAFFYLLRQKHACLNAHSLPVLPLCAAVARLRKTKLVYDTHELETEVIGSRGGVRPILKFAERLLIGAVDAVSVVNPEISDWYSEHYSIAKPWVVQNIPDPKLGGAGNTPSIDLRQKFDVPEGSLLFIYQGLLSKGRGLQIVLDAFERKGTKHHVVFMGYGSLEPDIIAATRHSPRIHFQPAVPAQQVLGVTRSADVGLALIEDICLSYRLSLPNKVFEYIECGVPVVASDFPVMSRVVRELEAGWLVKPDTNALVAQISSLNKSALQEVRTRMARRRGRFSWRNEEESLLTMYRALGFGVGC